MRASSIKSRVARTTSRRSFLKAFGTGLVLAVSVPAHSQSTNQKRRIAWYGANAFVGINDFLAAYEGRLAKYGMQNGQTVAVRLFDRQVPGSAPSRQREQAAISKMLEWRPDVIVVSGTADAVTLKRANPNAAVVFHGVMDPISAGLVASLRRPGGNFTGVTTGDDVLAIKRLEVTRELLPTVRRAAVVYSKDNETAFENLLVQMEQISRQLKLDLAMIGLGRKGGTVKEMLSRIQAAHAEAVIPVGELIFNDPSDPKMVLGIRAMLDFQAKAPFIDNDLQSVENGFLIAIGELETDRLRTLADITAKILNGANPASIPVDQPTYIRMWINLKTAKTLGLRIPPSILVRADRVIE